MHRILPPVQRKLRGAASTTIWTATGCLVKVGLLWMMASPAKCFCHHADWMFVYVMRGFLRACKRSLLLSAFSLRANPIHQTVMRTHVVICVLSPPLLHHLTVASALVAKMRTKSTTRIVSHFCVRRCLLFTVNSQSACPAATPVYPRGRGHKEVQLPPHFCRVLVTHSVATPHTLFK